MLAAIRRFAKSPWATGLMALLVMSFAVFGIRDVFNSGAVGDAVVKVGNRKITSSDFRKMFDRYLQGIAQQNGGKAISIQDAAAQGLDARALNEVAYEESVGALITHLGVRPSDKLVADELGKAQRFRDPLTGKFDAKAYKAFLRENNTTADEIEGSIRDQIGQQHLLTALVAGVQAPFAYTAVQAAYNGETRSFSYVALTPNMVPTPAPPTDAELQAFMKSNAAAFLRPEVRTVSLVRFAASQLAPTVALDPKDVQKRYDFEKDNLSTPEKRSLVQIPLKSASDGSAVAARLQKGDDPSAVAKSLGVQAVVLADFPATAIPDRAVADAAFAMKPGEVRTVAGSLGPTVIKLTGVTPGKAVTLDEARPKIEQEARLAAAAAKAQDLARKYDDARSGGANLHDAAAKAGVPVTALPPFTAQGTDAKGQHVPAPEKLITTAFALAQGGDSDVLQAAPGEFYAIRVEKVDPAAPVPLDEVRGPLSQRLTLGKLATALQAKADSLTAQAKADGSLDGVARSLGVPVQHASGVTRAAAGQPNAAYGPRLLGVVFGGKPGAVVVAPDKLTMVLARIDQVASAPLPMLVPRARPRGGPPPRPLRRRRQPRPRGRPHGDEAADRRPARPLGPGSRRRPGRRRSGRPRFLTGRLPCAASRPRTPSPPPTPKVAPRWCGHGLSTTSRRRSPPS